MKVIILFVRSIMVSIPKSLSGTKSGTEAERLAVGGSDNGSYDWGAMLGW